MTYQNSNLSVGDQLRHGMRQWASGIGVAAAEFEGVRHGMTVSSFTSVSVEPPIILISAQNNTRTHDLILRAGAFAVTLLSDQQQEISEIFAGRIPEHEDRFADLEIVTLETGSPVIPDGLAVFDCNLVGTYETDTTTVMFGEVVAARVSDRPQEDLAPLLYYQQGYHFLEGDK